MESKGESSLLVQSGLGHQRLRRLIQSAMVPKAVEARVRKGRKMSEDFFFCLPFYRRSLLEK